MSCTGALIALIAYPGCSASLPTAKKSYPTGEVYDYMFTPACFIACTSDVNVSECNILCRSISPASF